MEKMKKREIGENGSRRVKEEVKEEVKEVTNNYIRKLAEPLKEDILKSDISRISRLNLSMFDEKIKKDILIEIGDELCIDGEWDRAKKVYKKAGRKITPELLVEMGDRCIKKAPCSITDLNKIGAHVKVIDVYSEAGNNKKLIEVADYIAKFDASDYLDYAIEIYEKLGDVKGLKNLGDRCLKIARKPRSETIDYRGRFLDLARKAYEKVGDKKGLLEVGDRYLEIGLFIDDVIESYEKAGELTEGKLIEIGDKYINNGNLTYATIAYKKAGKRLTKEQILIVGDTCISEWNLDGAIEAYKKLGKQLTNEQLIEIGNIAITKGWAGWHTAKDAYEKAGYKDGLVEVGDKFLGKNHTVFARQCYEKANCKESLIKLGDKCFRNAITCSFSSVAIDDFKEAIEMYKKAGHVVGLIKVGNTCFEEGFYKEAIGAYKKAGREDLVKFVKANPRCQ